MPPHTLILFVGSARPELTPCAKSKSVVDRKRTYLQVTRKNKATEELKTRRRALT